MTLNPRLDLVLVTLVIGGFVFVASQRLGTVPVPEGDEAYMAQVSYEMHYRNKVAVPMMRYLGGNIENAWHSRTPVYFLFLRGFTRLFGFGLTQGRVFNLITATLTLLMVYLIGRRLFDWRAGLIAAAVLISDQTFLERSRLLRNDYSGAALSMLAFFLYEIAEQRKRGWLYAASGLAAGAGMMCHTNGLYMLVVIGLLMLMRHGWRLFKVRAFYQFTLSAFAVIAYEVVYAVVDFENFRLQNRGDKLHFQLLESWGWLDNVLRERVRYLKWYAGGSIFPSVPRTLLHLFQLLTVAAIVYLIVNWARRIREKGAMSDPRTHVLLATAVVTVFIAAVSGNKDIYYIAHLAPWFALCVGVMLRDGLGMVSRLRSSHWSWAKAAWRVAVAFVVLASLAYSYQLAKQNTRYLRAVSNPDLISFEEIKGVLRSVVPDGLCPVTAKLPVLWLAFPEKDSCFASIETRMLDAVDIDGRDYALITRPKNADYWARDLDEQYHLLGQLADTPYGNLLIYYTGVDPQFRALAPKRYHFFNNWRGHLSDEQIATALEVWSATAEELRGSAKIANPSVTADGLAIKPRQGRSGEDTFTELCSIELKPSTAYQLALDSKSSGEWEAVVIEETTGVWIKHIELRGGNRVSELFRTFAAKRVRILVRALTYESADPLYVSRIGIREISEL